MTDLPLFLVQNSENIAVSSDKVQHSERMELEDSERVECSGMVDTIDFVCANNKVLYDSSYHKFDILVYYSVHLDHFYSFENLHHYSDIHHYSDSPQKILNSCCIVVL